MPSTSIRTIINAFSALVVAIYAAIVFGAHGQFRTELVTVAYISFGVPITGLLANEWARLSWGTRWERLDVLTRGLFIASLAMMVGASSWLVGQMLIPYSDAPSAPANWIGRMVQPYYYCAISLGSLRVYVATTALRSQPSLVAVIGWLIGSAMTCFAVLGAVVFLHAVA